MRQREVVVTRMVRSFGKSVSLLRQTVGVLGALGLASAAMAADWDAGGGQAWKDLLERARAEKAPAVIAGCANAMSGVLPQAFKRDTGLEIVFLGGALAEVESRYRQEATTGRTTIDIRMGGSSEIDLARGGYLVDLREALILPDVIDAARWTGGDLSFVDNTKRFLAIGSKYVAGRVVVNTDFVPTASIQSLGDLLKPEFKGKIAMVDPTVNGAGQSVAAYFSEVKGIDFVKALLTGQEVAYGREGRQVAEWAARGVYPIIIGADVAEVQNFRKRGVTSLHAVALKDAPGSLVGGCSVVSILKSAPHAATAAVYANWYLSRAGQEAFVAGSALPSLRADAGMADVPADIVPEAGRGYIDQMSEDWYLNTRPRVQADLRRALDR